MKKIMIMLMLVGVMGFILTACKPQAGSAEIQELKDKITSLEEKVTTLESDLEALQTSLDELKTSFDEHMEKYHKGAPPKPVRPAGKTGGVKPPKRK